jgi:phosphoribosylformylglycinamidine cyclo-ligase
MYPPGEYDLAGFCVGLVDNNAVVDGSSIKVGDRIIGIGSSGPHANGYSLIRKLLAESGLTGTDTFPGTDRTVRDVLLAPTTIYADCLRNLMRDFSISGMAHITGGGFYDNIPRVLPAQVRGLIQFGAWDMPPVFSWIREQGRLTWPEMLQIFNCGIGFILIVNAGIAEEVVSRINALHLPAWIIGTVERQASRKNDQVHVLFDRQKEPPVALQA